MPIIIKAIDEIIQSRGRDTYWLRFASSLFADQRALRRAKEDQLAWLTDQGLAFETAAPKGWFEGDPGSFAIYFDDPDDARLAAYCVAYEQSSGCSLQPEMYQMYLVLFQTAEAG